MASMTTVHVFDEASSKSKDFCCRTDTLLQSMRYFRGYLKDVEPKQNVMISVHCDVQVFEWLLAYAVNKGSGRETLTIKTVMPILISSNFLGMDDLVNLCLAFVAQHLDEVAVMSPDLAALPSELLQRLAKVVEEGQLEALHVRCSSRPATPDPHTQQPAQPAQPAQPQPGSQDTSDPSDPPQATQPANPAVSVSLNQLQQLSGRLYKHRIEYMLRELRTTVARCAHCGAMFSLADRGKLECSARDGEHAAVSHTQADRQSRVRGHEPDPSWRLQDHLALLRAPQPAQPLQDAGADAAASQAPQGPVSWRDIYWDIWSVVHVLYCGHCMRYFPAQELAMCCYHPEPPIFLAGKSVGRYPCCGGHAQRSGTVQLFGGGCCARDHTAVVPSAAPTARAPAAGRVLHVLSTFRPLIVQEPTTCTAQLVWGENGADGSPGDNSHGVGEDEDSDAISSPDTAAPRPLGTGPTARTQGHSSTASPSARRDGTVHTRQSFQGVSQRTGPVHSSLELAMSVYRSGAGAGRASKGVGGVGAGSKQGADGSGGGARGSPGGRPSTAGPAAATDSTGAGPARTGVLQQQGLHNTARMGAPDGVGSTARPHTAHTLRTQAGAHVGAHSPARTAAAGVADRPARGGMGSTLTAARQSSGRLDIGPSGGWVEEGVGVDAPQRTTNTPHQGDALDSLKRTSSAQRDDAGAPTAARPATAGAGGGALAQSTFSIASAFMSGDSAANLGSPGMVRVVPLSSLKGSGSVGWPDSGQGQEAGGAQGGDRSPKSNGTVSAMSRKLRMELLHEDDNARMDALIGHLMACRPYMPRPMTTTTNNTMASTTARPATAGPAGHTGTRGVTQQWQPNKGVRSSGSMAGQGVWRAGGAGGAAFDAPGSSRPATAGAARSSSASRPARDAAGARYVSEAAGGGMGAGLRHGSAPRTRPLQQGMYGLSGAGGPYIGSAGVGGQQGHWQPSQRALLAQR